VKVKLAYKIFVVFLLTSCLVVALMVGIMRYYVGRGFADYVNKTALDNLDGLTSELAAVYEFNNGWHTLKDNSRGWRDILRSALAKGDLERFRPPARRDDTPDTDHLDKPVAIKSNANGVTDRPRSGTRLPKPFIRLARGLALFDADRNHVVGGSARGPADHYTLRSIPVDGRVVGWLGLHKREHLTHPLAISFLKEQTYGFYLIGGGILVLAAIVSFLLSKHLLAPVRQLANGTRSLAEFKFDTKIDVRSQDELGQLAMDFNRMAATLKKYETLRRQWLTDISHELRTPLAILKGEIEALQDGLRKPDQAGLDSLHLEVARLSKLVEDLHLLSLADSKSLLTKSDPVKLFEILDKMVNRFRPRLAKKGIEIDIMTGEGEGLIIHGDADQLAQLFTNLLDNSLKYTDSPGVLKIFERHTAQKLTLSFEDTAPGVPQDALERLFDRLYRVDQSRSRTTGGSGLGLAICKQIVVSHKGRIRGDHSPSGGLLIRIEFPLIHKNTVKGPSKT
jgi:two-component system sensor histidine kinase BaeS